MSGVNIPQNGWTKRYNSLCISSVKTRQVFDLKQLLTIIHSFVSYVNFTVWNWLSKFKLSSVLSVMLEKCSLVAWVWFLFFSVGDWITNALIVGRWWMPFGLPSSYRSTSSLCASIASKDDERDCGTTVWWNESD